MRILNDTQRNDNVFVISLWRHEVFSTIGNQLPRHTDSYWLECIINDLIKTVNKDKTLKLYLKNNLNLEICFIYQLTAFVR